VSGSAAACEDYDVDLGERIQERYGLHYVAGGAVALHSHRRDQQADAVIAPFYGAQYVAHRGSCRRRHHSDAARKQRQSALASGVKQPLRLKLCLQLLERQLQRAYSRRLQEIDRQLVLAPRLIDREPPSSPHRQAVRRSEPDQPVLCSIAGAADHRRLVLQREIPVARRMPPEIGDLALHQHVDEPPLEQYLDLSRQLRNRQSPAFLLKLVVYAWLSHEQRAYYEGLDSCLSR